MKDTTDLNRIEEPTDSDSDADDERFSPDAVKKRVEVFEKKFKRHEELLNNFVEAGNPLVFEIFVNFVFFVFSLQLNQ